MCRLKLSYNFVVSAYLWALGATLLKLLVCAASGGNFILKYDNLVARDKDYEFIQNVLK